MRSFTDQLERSGDASDRTIDRINRTVDRAERLADRGKQVAASVTLRVLAATLRGDELDDVQDAVRDLAHEVLRGKH